MEMQFYLHKVSSTVLSVTATEAAFQYNQNIRGKALNIIYLLYLYPALKTFSPSIGESPVLKLMIKERCIKERCRREHTELPSTELDHWSTKVSIVYSGIF